MKIPTRQQAEHMLAEAAVLNPGPWIEHSKNAARAAKAIAAAHSGLDPEVAYIFGCLHDIGRRAGVMHMRHSIEGYRYLMELGFDDTARICLTHSFPYKDVNAVFGKWDCPEEDVAFVEKFLIQTEFTVYDGLIQLSDALAMSTGFCLLEKRMIDVVLRYGTTPYVAAKWKATFEIKKLFEDAIGQPIYMLLPGVVENTFGCNPPRKDE